MEKEFGIFAFDHQTIGVLIQGGFKTADDAEVWAEQQSELNYQNFIVIRTR